MVHIRVVGRVQGVAFRFHTKQKADDLGVVGTVQNLEDGSVQIYANGDKALVDQLIDWCHNGSSAATVEEVIVQHIDDIHKLSNPKDLGNIKIADQFVIIR